MLRSGSEASCMSCDTLTSGTGSALLLYMLLKIIRPVVERPAKQAELEATKWMLQEERRGTREKHWKGGGDANDCQRS